MKRLSLLIISLLLTAGIYAGSDAEPISHERFDQLRTAPSDIVILDVRSKNEYDSGHIEGSINIEYKEIDKILATMSKNKPIVVYCRSGRRAGIVTDRLTTEGYQAIYHLDGDMNDWIAKGKPVVVKSK